MNASVAVRRRPDALWRRSLDTVVVLPAGIEDPLTIVGPGPEIWELLAEWRTLDSLVSLLAEAHGADPAVVRADVGALLEELAAFEALEIAADSGGRHGG